MPICILKCKLCQARANDEQTYFLGSKIVAPAFSPVLDWVAPVKGFELVDGLNGFDCSIVTNND